MDFNSLENRLPVDSRLVFEDTGGCISSLKHIPHGLVWTVDDIECRKDYMLCKGREWLVVDNLIVHEEIKLGTIEGQKYLENYRETLINLATCGVKVVCYNFMPVFYKVRTHFDSCYPHRHVFSLFDQVAFNAFDLYILNGSKAEARYSYYERHLSRSYFRNLSGSQQALLTENILSCIQSHTKVTLGELRKSLERYDSLSLEDYRQNYLAFKEQIHPLASSLKLKIHFNTDNPCNRLLGLPSVF